MKGKILVLLVGIALLVGVLSGCIEEEEEEPTNQAPTASITCITTGFVNASITFEDASTDEDGTIASWAWDLDDDDVVDSTEQDFTHIFTAEATYTITLIVTDDDDEASEEATPCTIVISYKPPTASITAEYLGDNITVNTTSVWLNSTITEGAGAITNYTWDFGDGSDLFYGADNTTHMFILPGTITVTLTVTDANGKEAIGTVDLTVVEET